MLDKFHILSFQCVNLLLCDCYCVEMIHKYSETRINKFANNDHIFCCLFVNILICSIFEFEWMKSNLWRIECWKIIAVIDRISLPRVLSGVDYHTMHYVSLTKPNIQTLSKRDCFILLKPNQLSLKDIKTSD